MSVSSITNKIVYTGSGTTGPFDFDFRVFVSSDLVVEKYTIATGVTTTLTITTDYTVTIDGDGTGYVTTVAAVTSAYKLVIRRVLPLTQEIDYVEGDKFPAETHEEGLDRSRMVDQQLQEQIDRAVLQNPTVSTQLTLPGAVTGNALAWASDGTLENIDVQTLGAITVDTDGTLAANSDDKVPTQKAVKTYVDAKTIPVKATGAELNTGTDDAKFATAKALADSDYAKTSDIPVKATGAEIDTGTDDAKFATPKAIADSGLLFTSFVDRGDPSGDDFSIASLTRNNTWNDLDLSSIVPVSAKAVILFVRNLTARTTADRRIVFRKNGNSNAYAIGGVNGQVNNIPCYGDITVNLSSGIIEYLVESTEVSGVITVKGWIL